MDAINCAQCLRTTNNNQVYKLSYVGPCNIMLGLKSDLVDLIKLSLSLSLWDNNFSKLLIFTHFKSSNWNSIEIDTLYQACNWHYW